MNEIKLFDRKFVKLISEEKIAERIISLGAELTPIYKDKNPVFVGILKGCWVFMADLVRKCDFEMEVAFMKVSSYQGFESKDLNVEYSPKQAFENRHVVIIEDIVDTGKTIQHLQTFMEEQNPASLCTVSLLLKPTALEVEVEINHVGFEIDDAFVVGYGLDYDQKGRNLPHIFQLAEGE